MTRFIHLRQKESATLERPRELIVAMPPMRSNVNVSRIVRLAGCCAVNRVIVCGTPKIDRKIARDGAESVTLEVRRSLPPVLKRLREDGYQLVGLEQTTDCEDLHAFAFERRTALILGHERLGLTPEVLELLDRVVEIPVWGLPHSYNVATSAAMALYEYCRQFPKG